MLLILILLLLVIFSAPNWGYHNYGWRPGGALGLVLIIVIILVLLGRL